MVVYVVNISYKNPFLQSFLGVNQLYTTCGSREFCHYKAPRNRKLYLYGKFGCLGLGGGGMYISSNTHSKSNLTVILRGQPTFYDQRFVEYGFCAILRL